MTIVLQALHFVQAQWFLVFLFGLGFVEFVLGFYGTKWTTNEKLADGVSFVLARFCFRPATAALTLFLLQRFAPGLKGAFAWVPSFWAFLIMVVADDLTQYWYHRLHHQIPWLWRFHRAHHAPSYMGVAVTYRQNFFYLVLFSQVYVTATLVYAGLATSAVSHLAFKSIIICLVHSSVRWDAPLYKYKVLHPIAWVVERVFPLPATHHAHHADTTDDGVGYYKGNFGNMLFIWDVIFGTAYFSRQYPKGFGISHYEGDSWYSQLFWPVIKSSIPNSELADGGPVVREDIKRPPVETAAVSQVAASGSPSKSEKPRRSVPPRNPPELRA